MDEIDKLLQEWWEANWLIPGLDEPPPPPPSRDIIRNIIDEPIPTAVKKRLSKPLLSKPEDLDSPPKLKKKDEVGIFKDYSAINPIGHRLAH